MKISTLKNVLTVGVILIGLAGYLFVRSTLDKEEIEVKERSQDSTKIIEEKPVDITLVIDNGRIKETYELEMKNTNTILDIIESLRQDNKLTYEKTAYIYGTEIDHINYDEATDNFKWKVYMTLTEKGVADLIKNIDPPMDEQILLKQAIDNEFDITYQFSDLNLVENGVYEFRLTRISEPQ